MFSDLIKAMKAPANKKAEPSEERLNELLSQLFGRETDASEEEEAPAPAPSMKAKKGGYMDKGSLSYFEGHGAREALDKAAEIEIEVEGDEEEGDEEEGEEMDKGAQMEGGEDKSDKEKRRELMSAAYSMIDNLSDDQLEEFLSAREVRKAQVMAVLGQMSTAELGELVGAKDAQGVRAVDAEKV
jgi:FAD/FMN-containing dehydrogenase